MREAYGQSDLDDEYLQAVELFWLVDYLVKHGHARVSAWW